MASHLHRDTTSDQAELQRQLMPHLENMASCDDCGLLFDNTHDLQRHVKRWCPENNLKRKRDDIEDGPLAKKPMYTYAGSDRNHEQTAFESLMIRAKSANEDDWQKKIDKYLKTGMSEKAAKVKAEEKMKQKDEQAFKHHYGIVISYIQQLQNGPVHRKIMDYLQKMLKDGYNEQKSIKMAINKYGYHLKALWDQEDDNALSEESDPEDVETIDEEDDAL